MKEREDDYNRRRQQVLSTKELKEKEVQATLHSLHARIEDKLGRSARNHDEYIQKRVGDVQRKNLELE